MTWPAHQWNPGQAFQFADAFPRPSNITPPALTTLTHINSFTGTANGSITVSSILEGDILVMLDVVTGAFGFPTAVVPTGFSTAINIADNSDTRILLSYGIADGAETSLAGMSGASTRVKVVHQFRGDVVPTLLTTGDVENPATTNGDPTAVVINASLGATPLIVLAGYLCLNADVVPRDFTPAADGEAGLVNTKGVYLAYKIYNSSPADVTIDTDDNGSLNWIGGLYLTAS